MGDLCLAKIVRPEEALVDARSREPMSIQLERANRLDLFTGERDEYPDERPSAYTFWSES